MIGSNLPPLHYVNDLKKSLANGTATAARFEVPNATPEVQAKLDQIFRETERDVEKLKARYSADPDWAPPEEKSNAAELPEVQTLSHNNASDALNSLQQRMEVGQLQGGKIDTTHSCLPAEGDAVYQEWLLARVGLGVEV